MIDITINGIEMITDRNMSDVEIAKSLIKKGFANMTEAERQQFMSGLRGAYNYTDFNRVENSVDYISKYLLSINSDLGALADNLGVAWDKMFSSPLNVQIVTKTDWSVYDTTSEDQRQRYLQNIIVILRALEIEPSNFPKTLSGLTYNGANLIESSLVSANAEAVKIKTQKETYIKNASKAWFYSGELYGGEI